MAPPDRSPRALAAAGLALAAAAIAGALALDAAGEPTTGSTSLGQPNAGHLAGAARLPDRAPGLSSPPSPRGGDPKHGTDELVGAILRAAEAVSHRAPGATLVVGDLSAEGGGPIPGHESHQAGRDVDLLFYSLDASGAVARPRAARFDGEGREVGAAGPASGPSALRFDTRRNWLVLRSLVEDPEAHLQRVLVSEPLRTLLLDWATRAGEPAWVVERAGEAMCDTWSPHDNHFHVRVFCTAEDYRRGCRDEHPFYPWRRTELAGVGLLTVEVLEDPHRSGRRAARWLEGRGRTRPWCP